MFVRPVLLVVALLSGGALGTGCSWGAQNIQIAPYMGCAPSPKPTACVIANHPVLAITHAAHEHEYEHEHERT